MTATEHAASNGDLRSDSRDAHPDAPQDALPGDPGGAPRGDRRASLGILVCGHAPEELAGILPDYPDLFVRLLGEDTFDYRRYAVVDGEAVPRADACDAWLITGSRHGVYEEHPWIAPLEALVREIRASSRPLVGICFGHQLVVQALGGRVEKHAGGWSVGRVEYRLDGHAEAVPLMAYHQDQVIEPPPGARVTGESDFCRYAALAIGDTVRTIQPHPEFDAALVGGLLDTRGQALPAHDLAAARASIEHAADVEVGRATIAAELREFVLEGIGRRRESAA